MAVNDLTREEILQDVQMLLVALAALTPRDTYGEELLREWREKYKQ